jgi:cytochrome c5
VRRALLVPLAVGGLALGCATAGAGGAPAGAPGRAAFRAKCGACHARPDPRGRDRAGWDAVLTRHRDRLPLDEAGWRELHDYLGGGAR